MAVSELIIITVLPCTEETQKIFVVGNYKLKKKHDRISPPSHLGHVCPENI